MAGIIPPFLPSAFSIYSVRVGSGIFTLDAPDGKNLDMTLQNSGDAPAWVSFGVGVIPIPGPNSPSAMMVLPGADPVRVPDTVGVGTATTVAIFSAGNAVINAVRGWSMVASRGAF
jgi:hypothetical protein